MNARQMGVKTYHNMVRHNYDAGWDVIKKLILGQAKTVGMDPEEIWEGVRSGDPDEIPEWAELPDVECPTMSEMIPLIRNLATTQK